MIGAIPALLHCVSSSRADFGGFQAMEGHITARQAPAMEMAIPVNRL